VQHSLRHEPRTATQQEFAKPVTLPLERDAEFAAQDVQ
jgi:hypothetical protein